MPTFIKRRTHAPQDFFTWESVGLQWLADAHGALTVHVIDVADDHIELDHLTTISPTPQAAYAFGAALATTHASGASAFGVGPSGYNGASYIGDAPLPLGEFEHWGDFYAQCRLLPYLRLAYDAQIIDKSSARIIEKVCTHLLNGEHDDDRPPARIHGDLWAGNVLYTPEGCVMIDPAAHGGHPETDLAMLSLFGFPYLDIAQTAYCETAGLDSDWRSRTTLHQLHPLLVHTVLFGGSYTQQLIEAARQWA